MKTDSKFVTIDNCHFWDTGKTSMCGMNKETGPNYITYHHNWFDHSDSRHARVRTISVHLWNNYYDGCAKYGIGATMGCSVFSENNYFRATKNPILISKQGSDEKGAGKFSGEPGGMVKEYGSLFTEKGAERMLILQLAMQIIIAALIFIMLFHVMKKYQPLLKRFMVEIPITTLIQILH